VHVADEGDCVDKTNKGSFHAGEQAMQAARGMQERMAAVGSRVIRDHMPEAHRELFDKLPSLLVGSLDESGWPWATMLCGAPGFVHTPNDRTLCIEAPRVADDPASGGLLPGAAVGLLGLEPHTRRRNRVNGVVLDAADDHWSVRVTQSFGNCPKYIQARRPAARRTAGPPEPGKAEGARLSDRARALVEQSDTLFIASSSTGRVTQEDALRAAGAGVDVSHRGGRPGFVRIERDDSGDTLVVPDYLGNFMFNTLGNLVQWPRAGLLFVDWDDGHLLHLAAQAEICDAPVGDRGTPPAQSYLRLALHHGLWRPGALPCGWTAADPAREWSPGTSRG
jgi:predicted pyridoxine 5'-phosphate oxidase superfamily flavin-nucleotide-binding protein